MMNLVSRCSERTPDVLASIASESPGKTWHEGQQPLSSWNEQHQRTWRLVLDAYSSSYSEWDADKNRSSQEWTSGELMEVRTGRPVYEQPPGLFTEHTDKFIVDDNDMDSDTDAEPDMSLLSRSFLHRVNDRVRKIQDQSSKDAAQDSNEHSLIWRMFVSSTSEASLFMGKNYFEILHSIKKKTGKGLTMKQMFDIFETLITEQSDEVYGVKTINWSDSAWKHLSSFGLWSSRQSLTREGLFIFRFCVMSWKGELESNTKYCLGGQVDVVRKFIKIQNFGHHWWANGIRVEYFPRIHHIAAMLQSPRLHVKNEHTIRRFQWTNYLMSMFNVISWGPKEHKQECESSAQLVSIFAKTSSPGRWSFFGLGPEKKWFSTLECKPQGKCDTVAELMM